MNNTVAIIYYSTHGHVGKLAEAEKKGIEAAGGKADIYLLPEILSDEALSKMHAPKKPNYPVATPDTLTKYDAFLFGYPTRYGTPCAQFRAFWDGTGGLWAKGALHGKYFGQFFSTGTQGGGQETTGFTALTSFIHHGMIFVPLGYKNTFAIASELDSPHGGSSYGAGTFAAADGSRFPSEIELKAATIQGETFYRTVFRI
ncbi:ubiquitinated histone-like protein Uhp1 [Schizosaccharomyces cryophilus OY26]|uniref:Ubiquitinated histone-like protein Uhp1 n=1 Tax=Schizosaccharomyces cryophilus (strain OY26 / ATCC MYA-4695 / CBS 11777 / NBRC 106824 / NRRL Y48691) TaxID=653667 RepID=S9VV98_SCHCR|nr:ubiquitinated histone-like protein Uhp1 [Schizosaccharomyces cryophilus OY26]EPY51708.1 ubiquitinated histone-like protein Uhp1 [Schizosaccharomyces cryophilus OY26]